MKTVAAFLILTLVLSLSPLPVLADPGMPMTLLGVSSIAAPVPAAVGAPVLGVQAATPVAPPAEAPGWLARTGDWLKKFGSGVVSGFVNAVPNVIRAFRDAPVRTTLLLAGGIALAIVSPPAALAFGAAMLAHAAIQTGGDPQKLGAVAGETLFWTAAGLGGARALRALKGSRTAGATAEGAAVEGAPAAQAGSAPRPAPAVETAPRPGAAPSAPRPVLAFEPAPVTPALAEQAFPLVQKSYARIGGSPYTSAGELGADISSSVVARGADGRLAAVAGAKQTPFGTKYIVLATDGSAEGVAAIKTFLADLGTGRTAGYAELSGSPLGVVSKQGAAVRIASFEEAGALLRGKVIRRPTATELAEAVARREIPNDPAYLNSAYVRELPGVGAHVKVIVGNPGA